MRHLCAAIALLVAWSGATSPAWADTDTDFQIWSALFATATLHPEVPGLQAWYDGHVRRGDPGTTVIVRPALGYKVAPWLSLWGGYAWVPVSSDLTGERVDEHRAWQQAILTTAALDDRLKLQARTRFEQRFHDTSSDTGLRLRQFIRLDYRFGPQPRWGAVVWDELFWGLNDPGFAPQGYDQNRLFAGPAFLATEAFRVEAGYLWVHLRRPPQTQHQHALALNFFLSL